MGHIFLHLHRLYTCFGWSLVLLLLFSLLPAHPVAAGSATVWTRLLGTNRSDYGTGVAVDPQGNIYVTGYTTGSLDNQPNAGLVDAFVAKYDHNGNKQWLRLFGTTSVDYASSIATDSGGNVYIAGYTGGSLDGQPHVGGVDAFVTKYDTDGNKQWTRTIGTRGLDQAMGVAVDAQGNVYTAGFTLGAIAGPVDMGGRDAFLAKYDADGNNQWIQPISSTDDDTATSVAVDRNGNIVVAGYTFGNLDGQTNAGFADAFVARYDSTGNKLWTQLLGSPAYDYALGVAVDDDGNITVAGHTFGNLDGQINAGSDDAFVARFDPNGNKEWTRLLGTASDDEAWGVAMDGNGNAYIAGSTFGNLDGQTNAGGIDGFVAKYDPSGNKEWTRLIGTAGDDAVWGIAVDRHANIFTTGYTGGNLDGQPNAGPLDVFVSQLTATMYLPIALRATAAGW